MQNSKLQLKIKKLLQVAILLTFNLSEAKAQTIDPSSWQTGATGLRTSSNPDRKTAGLTTIINASGIPIISVLGGVKDAGWGHIDRAVALELGEIKISSTTPALISESADWVHNEMAFTNNLKVWISRLSPAVLIQNQNPTLRLFSGNVSLYAYTPSSAPAYPKYVAYSIGGVFRVQAIPTSGASALTLPTLDNNWILVWYGNNAPFSDTKTPLSTSIVPQSDSYKADVPILFKFQNNPNSIRQTTEGGVDLTFSTNSGNTLFIPLFGREHPRVSDTESWGTGESLPASTITKINFWTQRLCSYPTNVSESYVYDSSNDTSTISENITYLPACSGGNSFAILPPIIALARDNLDTSFSISGSLTNASYLTEAGPIIGIDNANSYSWSVTGLKKYTDLKRVPTNLEAAPAAALTQELSTLVDKVTQAGHFKPWMISDSTPRSDIRGEIYFLNPADSIYHLIEVVGALPDSPTKTSLIDYIKSEKTSYPPETIYNLPDTGILRASQFLDNYSNWQRWGSPDNFLKRVPLYSFYALSKYYDLTTEAIPAPVITAAKTALQNDSAEQDWATDSWFKGFGVKHSAVENTNRYLTGLIGFTKLAKLSGDSDAESLGRALLAKTALTRLAMAEYPRYLYSNSLWVLPSGVDWMPRYSAGKWMGVIWNYNWAIPYDDPNQVVLMDQFGTYLTDSNGFFTPGGAGWDPYNEWTYLISSYVSAYKALVPENFRLLTDFTKQSMEVYVKKYTTFLPHWYMPNTEAILGGEHNINHPGDSFQIFMAKAFVQKDTPENLARYTSFPWLTDGSDLFYLHKLAETIKAYQGWKWEDEDIGVGIPGDVNNDAQVDVLDIQACVNYILGGRPEPGNNPDVNGDGSVNVLDVQNIVNIILGV